MWRPLNPVVERDTFRLTHDPIMLNARNIICIQYVYSYALSLSRQRFFSVRSSPVNHERQMLETTRAGAHCVGYIHV